MKKGFTLIELLIVIAVLGILAVAVLSAINPIEQINRSRDTGSRSDSEQLVSAVDRYYASRGYYPWTSGAASENTDMAFTAITAEDQAFGDDSISMILELTTETGELKESFSSRITDSTYNTLSIYNEGGKGDSTYLCFVPKSDAFADEGGDRCKEETQSLPDDYPASACPDGCAAAENCFSCLP